ncbi:MAG: acyltransferase [Fibrobacterota bacterium]|nr:acyltransferase [Fibrobacterota bacterium]QQS06564.1 MAG: acyltransferase [Fibrobacterota bacterium]
METSSRSPSFGAVSVRIPALEGLRGFAFLAVHFFHTKIYGPALGVHPMSRALGYFGEMGWAGVDLFFVLSGFLITGILLRQVGTPGWVGRFYVRRSVRILPIYYLVLVASVWVLPAVVNWTMEYALVPRANFVWYATFLHNWLNWGANGWPEGDQLIGQLWSLGVEEQFYLVWPALVALVGFRRLPAVAVGFVLGAPLLRMALIGSGLTYDAVYALTICRVDALAAGGLIALLKEQGKLPSLRTAWAMIAAGALLFFLTPLVTSGYEHPFRDQLNAAAFSWGLLQWCGLLVIALRSGPVGTMLEWKPLRFVGFYSYTLYLVSFPITMVAGVYWKKFLGPWSTWGQLGFFGFTLLFSLAIAWISWHLLEKRLLNIAGKAPEFR